MSDDTQSPSTPFSTLPEEPMPIPVVPPISTEPSDILPTPASLPKDPVSTLDSSNLVESILETKQPDSLVVPPPPSAHHQSSGSKKSGKGPLLALVAILLLVLPISVFFISRQNQQLSDVRSRASGTTGTYPPGGTCSVSSSDPNGGCGTGYGCSCRNGSCTCQPNGNQNNCYHTICPINYHCVGSGGSSYCAPNTGDDDNGDDDDDTVTSTPTPTTGVTPICQDIKLYKGGTQVTDLTTLRAGDAVVLAVKGSMSPTKAHFRVNGGTWTETTTTNSSSEYTLAYTIPAGITDFVIEGEVFTNGAWR